CLPQRRLVWADHLRAAMGGLDRELQGAREPPPLADAAGRRAGHPCGRADRRPCRAATGVDREHGRRCAADLRLRRRRRDPGRGPGVRGRGHPALDAREAAARTRTGAVISPAMDDPREFFETLESRVDPSKAAGLTAKYLFEIEGAGNWTVDVDDGKVSVSENGGDADCTISTSSETFMKIANGEQNPTAAYMSGKLKVKGDMGQAMKLQKLF